MAIASKTPSIAPHNTMSRATVPALAAALRQWFPHLNQRAVAVSEAEVTKENVPHLPVAMVALKRVSTEHHEKTNKPPRLTEEILIQIMEEPERYKLERGTQSPFWSYYDYDALQDVMISRLMEWRSPKGGRIEYRGFDIEADELAVTMTFDLRHTYDWCEPDEVTEMVRGTPSAARIHLRPIIASPPPVVCATSAE